MGGVLPDLAGPGGEAAAAADARHRGAVAERARHDRARPTRHGRADLHIHTIASDGTADVAQHPRARRRARRPRRHRHHRPRAHRRGRGRAGDGRGPRARASRSSSARRSRRSAATCWRCGSTGRSGPTARCATTIKAVHDAGGLAIPAHPLVPYPLCAQGRVLRDLLDDGDETVRPGRPRDVQPDGAGPAVARSCRALRR